MSSSEPWLTLGRDFDASLAIFRDPSREVHVAARGREIVGFVVLTMTGAFVGYIQSVGVAAAERSGGVGGRLLDFAEQRILAVTSNVFLCVSSFNPRARALYLRRGYDVVGELRDYLIPGHSEWLLRKTTGPLLKSSTAERRGGA